MVILPVVALLALLASFATPDRDLRDAFVRAAVVWGAILLMMSEILSVFLALAPIPVACSWALVSVIAVPWGRQWTKQAKQTISNLPFAIFFPIAVIVTSTAAVALAAAPNNFDSMTYHMSRVAHWIQDRSLRPYATNIHRQLFMGDWVECAILNIQLLSGGSDRFANLVQWSGFVGCMIGTSAIVARLGGTPLAQWTAALLVATTPELVAQSTSTQTDVSCPFWVVCFVRLVLWEESWLLWNSRLHTAVFVLGVVPVAFMLSGLMGREIWQRGIAFSLLALVLPWVFLNASRPVFNLPAVGSVFTTPREAQDSSPTRPFYYPSVSS